MVVAGAGGVVAVSFLVVTVAREQEVRAMAGEVLGRMAMWGRKMPSTKMYSIKYSLRF